MELEIVVHQVPIRPQVCDDRIGIEALGNDLPHQRGGAIAFATEPAFGKVKRKQPMTVAQARIGVANESALKHGLLG